MSDNTSDYQSGRHVREGVVVKTVDGRFRGKWVGEGYKLRKNAEDVTDE